jgi:hypothetical protein
MANRQNYTTLSPCVCFNQGFVGCLPAQLHAGPIMYASHPSSPDRLARQLTFAHQVT